MWRNYLTVGFRSVARNKVYAFINLFGLTLGIAACLLILLYVRYETSYDSWLPDAERVFQVQTTARDPESGEVRRMQASPRPIGPALAKDFAQIELVAKAEDGPVTVLANGRPEQAEMVMADPPLFRILALPFLRGDPARALDGADSLAISRGQAMKRFGTIDALGRTVTIVGDGGKRELKVTGVFEDPPRNSHLDWTMVTRFREEWECGWSCVNGPTYVKLRSAADAAAINGGLADWEKRNIPTETVGGAQVNEGDNLDWRLVSLPDIHLTPADGDRPSNDRGTLITFSTVALLILFMASVNFTNLATARAGQRAREVGLRKVLGATRAQLIGQFLGESVLLAACATLLALALVELTLPAFSAFLGADFQLDYLGGDGVLLPILLLMLFVGLAGGAYPAFFLSRYRPGEVLKANKSAVGAPGSGRLRNLLVVAQFAISIGLIVCTAIIYRQTLFVTQSSAGFDRAGLIQIEGLRRPEVQALGDVIAREIERIEGVTSVARTDIVPASGQTLYTMVTPAGRADPEKIGWYNVEPRFFEAMRVPIVAGRALSRGHALDSAVIPATVLADNAQAEAAARALVQRGLNIVLNEAAARALGFASPAAAVGQRIGLSLFGDELGVAQATIVGVAANSRFRSLREPIEPTIYYDTGSFRRLVVRFEGASPAAVMEGIERVWRRLVPETPLKAEFTDAKLAELYDTDARRGQIFLGFALLAMTIACLGLFGLAAFTAERRTKEIGVRKVFGATVADIVRLLAWQFSKPVVLANLIAWPVAWWVMRDWLNGFDARIALTPGPFVMAGLLALAIAIGTVAGHAIRVARTNPVHALRYE